MKKKNIAIMMTGITVTSAVAPIFAAQPNTIGTVTVDTVKGKEIVGQIRKALEVKYDETKMPGNQVGDNIFSVKVDNADVANAGVIENKIDALKSGQSLTIQVTEKGNDIVDGKRVDYKKAGIFKSQREIKEAIAATASKSNVKVLDEKTDSVTVQVEGKKGETTIKVGDDIVDFTKPVYTDSKLTGFETKYEAEQTLTYNIVVENKEAVDAKTLFDGTRLTAEGSKLLTAKENSSNITVTNGNIGTVATTTGSTIGDPDLGFTQNQKPYFEIEVNDGTSKRVITVSNENQDLVEGLYNILSGKTIGVKTMIGETRFDTAVQVSQEMYADGAADSVVLVGEDSIVDGLAAAPLAKEANGSILLTKKDTLPAETEKEMLRVLGDNAKDKTIYLVGGEAKISKELEENVSKLGAKVVRLAGENRFETSLKIADTMNNISTASTVYVVGGNGEADAMSISAYAAQTSAPIVVVDKNGVSEETAKFLEGKDIEIVGGTGVVSEEVANELKAIDKDGDVERIAGQTRQETNAKVISAKYNGATQAYIAKDGYVGGNGKLIDALAVAPLAATKNAPIILTTNDLKLAQQESVQANLSNVKDLTQVGGGVIDSAIKMIVNLIKK